MKTTLRGLRQTLLALALVAVASTQTLWAHGGGFGGPSMGSHSMGQSFGRHSGAGRSSSRASRIIGQRQRTGAIQGSSNATVLSSSGTPWYDQKVFTNPSTKSPSPLSQAKNVTAKPQQSFSQVPRHPTTSGSGNTANSSKSANAANSTSTTSLTNGGTFAGQSLPFYGYGQTPLLPATYAGQSGSAGVTGFASVQPAQPLQIGPPQEHDVFGDIASAAATVGGDIVQAATDAVTGDESGAAQEVGDAVGTVVSNPATEAVATTVAGVLTGGIAEVLAPVTGSIVAAIEGLGPFKGVASSGAGQPVATNSKVPTLVKGHPIAKNSQIPAVAANNSRVGGTKIKPPVTSTASNGSSPSGTNPASTNPNSSTNPSSSNGSSTSPSSSSGGSASFGGGGSSGSASDDSSSGSVASSVDATPVNATPVAATPADATPVAETQATDSSSSVDLVLEDVQLAAPATAVAGPAVRVTFRNQGTSDAGKFRVAILAGRSGMKGKDAPRVVTLIDSLAAGQQREVTLRLPQRAMQLVSTADRAPEAFTALFVIVDLDRQVVESDKTNNTAMIARDVLEAAR